MLIEKYGTQMLLKFSNFLTKYLTIYLKPITIKFLKNYSHAIQFV